MKNLGARLQDSVKGAHLGERAKNALQSIEKGVTNALAERTGELDEAVKAEHSQLSALKQSFNELSVTVKKDAERAGKSSKTHQELQQQLSGLVDLEPTLRESAAPALTTSAALGRCWAEYSEAVGVSLVDPAKQELSLLFAEGSTLYGSYARLCNEIALKSRREKGGVSAELAELQGKKAAQEGEVGARLRALRAAALEVIAYFVERYDTHQASFAGELLRIGASSSPPCLARAPCHADDGSAKHRRRFRAGAASHLWRHLSLGRPRHPRDAAGVRVRRRGGGDDGVLALCGGRVGFGPATVKCLPP